MKRTFAIFAIVMTVFLTTSCQKDDNSQGELLTFKAVVDHGPKTHLEGEGWLGVAWDNNDRVMLVTENGHSSVYAINSISGNVATFYCTNQPTDQNSMTGQTFRALYPANYAKVISDGSVMLDLPQTQYYAENSMQGSPMYALYNRSSNNNGMFNQNDAPTLRFKNLCSQLRLNLQASNTIVKSITIDSPDENICLAGDFSIYPSNDGSEGWEARTIATPLVSGMHRTVTLSCGSGVDISTAKEFNIYLPVGTYKVRITVRTPDGSSSTLTATSPIEFYRNHVMRLTRSSLSFTPPDYIPPSANAGVFAVSATEHVYLAPSNLMNTVGPNSYYDDSWTLGRYPYDMIGEYANNQTTWNRFSWSTDNAGDKYGMKVDGHTDQTQNNGNFQDWGINEIKSIHGDTIFPANAHFTLSSDQWKYLLGITGDRLTRHMASGMTSCYSFAYILPAEDYEIKIDANTSITRADFISSNTPLIYDLHRNNNLSEPVELSFPMGVYDCYRDVNGRQCAGIPVLVIYPDNFPADKQIDPKVFYATGITNKGYALSEAWYHELQQLGCVFMPLLGRGLGSGTATTSSEVFYRGYYWTSTSQSDNQANHLVLQHNNTNISVSIGSDTRSNGYAVRLAMPAPADR